MKWACFVSLSTTTITESNPEGVCGRSVMKSIETVCHLCEGFFRGSINPCLRFLDFVRAQTAQDLTNLSISANIFGQKNNRISFSTVALTQEWASYTLSCASTNIE